VLAGAFRCKVCCRCYCTEVEREALLLLNPLKPKLV
jgi:hypothetical protein